MTYDELMKLGWKPATPLPDGPLSVSIEDQLRYQLLLTHVASRPACLDVGAVDADFVP